MSATVAELIGQIINPPMPSSAPPASAPRAAVGPTEPLHVLLGRIVHPPFGPALASQPPAQERRAVVVQTVA